MAHKIHVLLVEHDGRDHDKTKNMLHYFSYEVTPVKLASTALSILSKGKGHFDVVMANMNSPDSYAFQLLQDAVRMGLLVILMSDDDDAVTTLRAIEQGAFLCIKKPITLQIVRYLWQHVLREKVGGVNKREQFGQITKCNTFEIEFGEEDLIEGSRNENDDAEQTQKSKKKANSGTSLEHDNVIFRRKVWTEWTQELHDKFMDAVRRLGEGRCYPKEILELMDVPGLTRMQVASHLQKCRNANWVPPSERRSKQENPETTDTITRKNKLQRAKTMRFGSMPQLDCNQQKIQQQLHKNYQELTIAPPNGANVLGDIHDGIADKGYYLHLVLNNDNATFNKGNLGQTFDMNEETFIYGAQSVTPSPNTSSNQRYISEDGYEFPIMDSMVQDFSTLQQELGLDFNGSLQSLVLDQGYYDQMPATNMYWCHEEGTKSLNNEENEGQMGEESWA